MNKVFFCPDTPEAILSAIYDAWADPLPNRNIRIETGGCPQLSLFEEAVPAEVSYEKAEKVILSVKKKLGLPVWELAEGALLASCRDKGDAVFRFMRYAFSRGRDVSRELTVPEVLRCFELNRKARGEAHLLLGFLRFQKLPGGLYFAKAGPVNDVLPLIADHFSARFHTQRFLIYDEKRKRSVVYTPGLNWYILEGELTFPGERPLVPDDYEKLWQSYFDAAAIRERSNPLCQRTHCPLHFRKYMTEF